MKQSIPVIIELILYLVLKGYEGVGRYISDDVIWFIVSLLVVMLLIRKKIK